MTYIVLSRKGAYYPVIESSVRPVWWVLLVVSFPLENRHMEVYVVIAYNICGGKGIYLNEPSGAGEEERKQEKH